MSKPLSALRRTLRSFLADTIGANMVEYLVVVGLVALAAAAGFQSFGTDTKGAIENQGKQVKSLGGK
jgi:pilus assembly protein Flp/PilA